MSNEKSIQMVQSVIKISNKLLASGRTEDACLVLEIFLAEEGDNAIVLNGLARIKMLQKKPHEAVPLFERALAIIQEEKVISQQNLRRKNTSLGTSWQDEDEYLSDMDLIFIEETSHEVKTKRQYHNWDDTIPPIDNNKSPNIEATSQSQNAIWLSNQEDDSEESLTSDEVENISDDSSHDLTLEEELFGLDDLDIIEEFPDSETLEDIIHIDPANIIEFAYEHTWGEFEPVGVEYDDEITGNDIFDLPTESRLTRLERARQVAIDLGGEYGWDEYGITILTMIFFKHWWSATRRSMKRELEAGVTPDELSIADEAREIWLKYPEFSEAHNGFYGLTQKFLHLPWPNALALIRSLGGYPDPDEIEKLLVDLYEHWRDKPSLIDAYGSFKHYLEYQIGRGRSSLREPPGLSFEVENNGSEAWGIEEVDEICIEADLRKNLLALGVDLESMDIHRIDCFRKWEDPSKDSERQRIAEGTDEKMSVESPCEEFDTYKKDNPSSPHAKGDNKAANKYRIGGRVRILNGTFRSYEGEIVKINNDYRGKLRVLMSVFGHRTEANFYFDEVENI